MYRTEFTTPWAQMKAMEETIRRADIYPKPEPFADRHTITYFNNGKQVLGVDYNLTAYDRRRDTTPFDPKKPRCDGKRQSLLWAEIAAENERHKVPMTTNHWYGRPNRVQIDYPEAKFYRSRAGTETMYRRNGIHLGDDQIEDVIKPCWI